MTPPLGRRVRSLLGLGGVSLRDRVIAALEEELRIRGLGFRLRDDDALEVSRPAGTLTTTFDGVLQACAAVHADCWPTAIARHLGIADLPLVAPRSLDDEGHRRRTVWEHTNDGSPGGWQEVLLARMIRDELLRRGYAYGIEPGGGLPPMRFELHGDSLLVTPPGVDPPDPGEPATVRWFLERHRRTPADERDALVSQAVDLWTSPAFWAGHRLKMRPLPDDDVQDAYDALLGLLGSAAVDRLRGLLSVALERHGYVPADRVADLFDERPRGTAARCAVAFDLTVHLDATAYDDPDAGVAVPHIVHPVELVERCAATEQDEWPTLVGAWTAPLALPSLFVRPA